MTMKHATFELELNLNFGILVDHMDIRWVRMFTLKETKKNAELRELF